MSKLHTRQKRRQSLSSHAPYKGERYGVMGAKTFGSELAARTWAENHGVLVKQILPAKRGKRFRIVSA